MKLNVSLKRKFAWGVALFAYVGPPAWAHFAIEADAIAQRASRGWVCGNPALGILFLAALAAGVLSLAAVALDAGLFRREALTSWRYYAEMLAVSAPFFCAAAFLSSLFCS